jgi:hypothetical protein
MKTDKKGESASILADRAQAAKRTLAGARAEAKRLKVTSREAKAAVRKAKKIARAAAKAARAAKETAGEARRDYKKAFARAEKARGKAMKMNAKTKQPTRITTPRKSSRTRHVSPPRPRTEPPPSPQGVDFEASFSDSDLKELEPQ